MPCRRCHGNCPDAQQRRMCGKKNGRKPLGMDCSVKKNKCKCPKLELEEVRVDLGAVEGSPKAVFSLGKCFPLLKVTVTATISEPTNPPLKQTFHLKTDKKGVFCFPLPLNTTGLEVSVKVKLPGTIKCTRDEITSHCCVKLDGIYVGYDQYDLIWRSYDGSANNLSHPDWGKADIGLLRKAASAYEDGVSSLAVRGGSNPNPRTVSNNICKSSGSVLNGLGMTDMVWVWGQFLDHEIDLTKTGGETAHVVTPQVADDPEEDYPGRTIEFHRSLAVFDSNPREQPNDISCFIDATNVYGYSSERAYALRKLDGSGKLRTELASGNGEVIMPYNLEGLDNAMPGGSVASDFFLAGDIRANENTFLTAMHTLFVREHNRLCDLIVANRPSWTGKDELIYQHARRLVSGYMQSITYNEYLPALLGTGRIATYSGYQAGVNPGIATEFSTAGYRLGHSMLSSTLRDGPDVGDTVLLRDAFFNPGYVGTNGIEGLLIGASRQVMQEIDGQIVDDVRNFLFGPPTAMAMLDLAVLNIQRGRDHGLPGYNDVREAYGLARKTTFAGVTSNVSIQGKLAALYGHPDHIDPWVGCLVEDHVSGAGVGELLVAILKDQFERLRDGDRFWFENDSALSDAEKAEIRGTRLSDIIIRNTAWTSADINADVFHL